MLMFIKIPSHRTLERRKSGEVFTDFIACALSTVHLC